MKIALIVFGIILMSSVAWADRFYFDPAVNYSSRQSEYDDKVFYYYSVQPNGNKIPIKSSTGANLWGWYYDADGNILQDSEGKNIAGSYTVREPIYDADGVVITGGFNLSPEPLENYSLQGIQGVR